MAILVRGLDEMDIYQIIDLSYAIFFFILGTVMGSFYNVVGYRLPHGGSLLYPPSHCPNCDHRLGALELIPILSFIIQGGKCKNCKQPISFFYPIFEFATGVLFCVSYYIWGFTPELFIALIVFSTLLIVIISDYKYMVISDEVLIFSSILLAVTYFVIEKFNFITLFYHILDGAIAFAIMFIIKKTADYFFQKEAMGGGDVKLMFFLGLVLGPITSSVVIALSAFIALPVAIILLLCKKENVLPYGPFLSIAAMLLFIFNVSDKTIIDWFSLLGSIL